MRIEILDKFAKSWYNAIVSCIRSFGETDMDAAGMVKLADTIDLGSVTTVE